ncbi:hypothetical protein WA158_006331 [Blastocystis sp. Blastoise]
MQPTFKQRVIYSINKFAAGAQENCIWKGVLASIAGFGAGASMGVFFATFEGSHGEIIGSTQAQQLKNGFKRSFALMAERGINYGVSFALFGFIFACMQCTFAKIRAKDDYINNLIGGGVTGVAFGTFQARHDGFKQMCKLSLKNSLFFMAFGVAIDYALEAYKESQRKTMMELERKERNNRSNYAKKID